MQRRSPSEPRTHRSASLRPRRSRPPAQGCGRETATLGPTSRETIQPQRGCASCAVLPSVTAGTALRFNRYSTHSQGRPHSIRPTPGWRPQALRAWGPSTRPQHSSPNAFLAKRRRHSALQPGRFPTPTAFPASSPGLRSRDRYPGTMSRETIQPQRGCASYAVLPSVPAGTALRFNRYSTHSQGRPHSIRPTSGWRPRALRAGFRPPVHPRTRLEGNTQSPIKRRSARFRFTHATISLRRLSARGFLNQRTPSFSTESGTPRLVARLSGWNFQKPPMCATEDRGRGGSCAHSRPARPNDHPKRVGQGTETRIKSLAQRTNCPANTPGSAKRVLVSVRVAKWLCVFLGQRFQSPVSYSLHRRAGRASSQNHLPSGITGTVEKARRDLGRKTPLGLAHMTDLPHHHSI